MDPQDQADSTPALSAALPLPTAEPDPPEPQPQLPTTFSNLSLSSKLLPVPNLSSGPAPSDRIRLSTRTWASLADQVLRSHNFQGKHWLASVNAAQGKVDASLPAEWAGMSPKNMRRWMLLKQNILKGFFRQLVNQDPSSRSSFRKTVETLWKLVVRYSKPPVPSAAETPYLSSTDPFADTGLPTLTHRIMPNGSWDADPDGLRLDAVPKSGIGRALLNIGEGIAGMAADEGAFSASSGPDTTILQTSPVTLSERAWRLLCMGLGQAEPAARYIAMCAVRTASAGIIGGGVGGGVREASIVSNYRTDLNPTNVVGNRHTQTILAILNRLLVLDSHPSNRLLAAHLVGHISSLFLPTPLHTLGLRGVRDLSSVLVALQDSERDRTREGPSRFFSRRALKTVLFRSLGACVRASVGRFSEVDEAVLYVTYREFERGDVQVKEAKQGARRYSVAPTSNASTSGGEDRDKGGTERMVKTLLEVLVIDLPPTEALLPLVYPLFKPYVAPLMRSRHSALQTLAVQFVSTWAPGSGLEGVMAGVELVIQGGRSARRGKDIWQGWKEEEKGLVKKYKKAESTATMRSILLRRLLCPPGTSTALEPVVPFPGFFATGDSGLLNTSRVAVRLPIHPESRVWITRPIPGVPGVPGNATPVPPVYMDQNYAATQKPPTSLYEYRERAGFISSIPFGFTHAPGPLVHVEEASDGSPLSRTGSKPLLPKGAVTRRSRGSIAVASRHSTALLAKRGSLPAAGTMGPGAEAERALVPADRRGVPPGTSRIPARDFVSDPKKVPVGFLSSSPFQGFDPNKWERGAARPSAIYSSQARKHIGVNGESSGRADVMVKWESVPDVPEGFWRDKNPVLWPSRNGLLKPLLHPSDFPENAPVIFDVLQPGRTRLQRVLSRVVSVDRDVAAVKVRRSRGEEDAADAGDLEIGSAFAIYIVGKGASDWAVVNLEIVDDDYDDGLPLFNQGAVVPVPAGVTINGDPYFVPPVTLPPVPAGYTPDGQPYYGKTATIKAIPAGMTTDGIRFYSTEPQWSKDSTRNQLAGYDNDGQPFFLPRGYSLPPPSGYTTDGIPYYDAATLLQQKGNMFLPSMIRNNPSMDRFERLRKEEEWSLSLQDFSLVEHRTVSNDNRNGSTQISGTDNGSGIHGVPISVEEFIASVAKFTAPARPYVSSKIRRRAKVNSGMETLSEDPMESRVAPESLISAFAEEAAEWMKEPQDVVSFLRDSHDLLTKHVPIRVYLETGTLDYQSVRKPVTKTAVLRYRTSRGDHEEHDIFVTVRPSDAFSCSTSRFQLQGEGVIEIPVTFSPEALKTDRVEGTLILMDEFGNKHGTCQLSGTRQSYVTVSPPFINAGWVLPDRRKHCHINVENISTANVTISVAVVLEVESAHSFEAKSTVHDSSTQPFAFHTTTTDARLQPNEMRQILVTFEPSHLGRFREVLRIEAPGGDVTRVILEGIAGIPVGIYPEDDTSSLAGAAALTLERCHMMKTLNRGDSLVDKPHIALDDVGRSILRNIMSSTVDYVSRKEAHTLDFGICAVSIPRMRCVTFLNLSDSSIGIGLYSHHPAVRCTNHLKVAAHMAVTLEVELITDEKHGVRGTIDTWIEAVCPDFQTMQIYVKAFVGQPFILPYWDNIFFKPCRVGETESLDLTIINCSKYHLSFTFEDLELPSLGHDVRQSNFSAQVGGQQANDPIQLPGCSMLAVTFSFFAGRRGLASSFIKIKLLPPHNRVFAGGLGNKPLRLFGICIEPYSNESVALQSDDVVLRDKNGIEFIRSWMAHAHRVTEEIPVTRSQLEEIFDITIPNSGDNADKTTQVQFQKNTLTFLPPQSKGGALAQLDEYLRRSQRLHATVFNNSDSASAPMMFFGSPNLVVEPSIKSIPAKFGQSVEVIYLQPAELSDTLTTIGFATGISEKDHQHTSVQVIAKHRPDLLVFPVPNKLNEVVMDFGKVEARTSSGSSDGPATYILLCNSSNNRYIWEFKFSDKSRKYNPFSAPLCTAEVRPMETSYIPIDFRADVAGSYESEAEIFVHDPLDKELPPSKLVSIVLIGTSASTSVTGFPDFIQYGSMLVLRSKSRKFVLRNNGTALADVNILLKTPFYVHPSNFRLPPNSEQEVTIVFSPTESGFSQADCHAFVNHKLYTFPITGIGGTAELVCEKYQNKDVEIGAHKEGTVAFITCFFTNVGTLPIELKALVASVPELLRVEFSGISATVPHESGKSSDGLKEIAYVKKDHWGVLRRKLRIFAILKDILKTSRYQTSRAPGKVQKRSSIPANAAATGTALFVGKADLMDVSDSSLEAIPILKPYNSYIFRIGYAPQHSLSRRDTELTFLYSPVTTEDEARVAQKLIKSTQLRIVGSVYRTLELFPPFHDFGVAPAEQYTVVSQASNRIQGTQYYGVTAIASTSTDKSTFTVDVLNLGREMQNLTLAFISPEFSVSGRTWTVGAGDRISIPVEFHPPLEQMQYRGEARFVHKYGQTVITLSGIGASADVAMDDHLDFGKIRLNTETVRTLKVTNRGLIATRLKMLLEGGRGMQTEIGVGDEPNEYDGSVDSGTSFLIPIKASCFVLEPVAPSLLIRWQRVPRGVWIERRLAIRIATGQPMMALNPPELDFKTTYIGLNKALNVLISNDGNAACSWSLSVEGDVLEAEPRAGYLMPGDQGWVAVSFNPVDFTPLNHTITFDTDAGTRYLVCSGIVGVPFLKIENGGEIDFGIIALNKTHTRTVSIRNTGNRRVEYDVSIVDGTIDGQPIQPEDFEVFFVEPMHDVIPPNGTAVLKFTAMPRIYNSTMSATYVVTTADGEYSEGQLCVTGGKAIIHVESVTPAPQEPTTPGEEQLPLLPQVPKAPLSSSSEQLKLAFQAQLENMNAIVEELGSAERVNAEEAAKQDVEAAESVPETPLGGRPLPPISRAATSHRSTPRTSTAKDRLATPQLRRLGSLRNRSPVTSQLSSPDESRPVTSSLDDRLSTPSGHAFELTTQFANEITSLKHDLESLVEGPSLKTVASTGHSFGTSRNHDSATVPLVVGDKLPAARFQEEFIHDSVQIEEQGSIKSKLESLADKAIQQTKVIFGASKDFLGSRFTKNKDGLATALRRLQETTVLLEQTSKPQATFSAGQSEAFNLGTVKGGGTTAKRLLFNLPNTGNLSFGFQIIAVSALRLRPNDWDADGSVDLFQIDPPQGSISPGETREFSATFVGNVVGQYVQGYELQSDGEVIIRFILNAKVGNPILKVNPTSVDFGLLKKKQTANRSILLSNIGTYPDNFVIVGTTSGLESSTVASVFDVEPKGGTLEIGQSIPLVLTFAPQGEGPYARKLKVQWSKEPLVLEIKGVGGAVRLKPVFKTADDTALRGLDLGICVVGYRADRIFELTNVGNVEGVVSLHHPLATLTFEIVSPDAGMLPFTLQPDKTITIRANFEPDTTGTIRDPIEVRLAEDDTLLIPLNALCGKCDVSWKEDLVLRNMPMTEVQTATIVLTNNGDFDTPIQVSIEAGDDEGLFRIRLDGGADRTILRPGQDVEVEVSVRPKDARIVEGRLVFNMVYGRAHEVRKEIPFKFRVYSQPVALNESENANVGRVAAGEVENVDRSITNYSNEKVQYRVRLESIARTPPAESARPSAGGAPPGKAVRKTNKGTKPSTPPGKKVQKKDKLLELVEESGTPSIIMPWVITTPHEGFIDPGDTANIAVAFKAHLDATEDWQEARAVIEQLHGVTGTWKEISTVKLMGASGHPKLVVLPERISFPAVGIGKRKALNFVVRNEGTANLKYQVINEWPERELFDIDESILPLTGNIEPGQEAKYNITFAPKIAGAFESKLTIKATLEVKEVPITGEGAVLKLMNVPERLELGDIYLGEDGTLSKDKFEIQNGCMYDLHVTAEVFGDGNIETGPCASDFSFHPADVTLSKLAEVTSTTFSINYQSSIPLKETGLPDTDAIADLLKERQWFAKLTIENGDSYVFPVTGRFIVHPLIVTSKENLASAGKVESLIATDGLGAISFGQMPMEESHLLEVLLCNQNSFKLPFSAAIIVGSQFFKLVEPDEIIAPKSAKILLIEATPPLIDESREVPPFVNVTGQVELSTSITMIPRRVIELSVSFVDIAGEIVLSPLDFESILVTETRTLEVSFRNPVRRSLSYSFTVQREFNDVFVLVGDGQGTVAPRQSKTLILEFRPQAPNLYQAVGRLETDHTSVIVELSGRAIEPEIDTGISTLDFGTVGFEQPEFRKLEVKNICGRGFRFRARVDHERFKIAESTFDLSPNGTVNIEVEFSPAEQGVRYTAALFLDQIDSVGHSLGTDPFFKLPVLGTGGVFKMALKQEEDELTETIEVASGEERPEPIPLTFPEVRITERVKKHFEVYNMGDTVLDMGVVNHLGQEVKDGESIESVNVTYKVSPTRAIIPPGSKARFTIAVRGVSSGHDEFALVVKTRTTSKPKEIPVTVDATVTDRPLTPSADRPDTSPSASVPRTSEGGRRPDELLSANDPKPFDAIKTFALADPSVAGKIELSRLGDPNIYRSDEGVDHILAFVLRLKPGLPSSELRPGMIPYAEPVIRDSDLGGLLIRPAPVPTDVPVPKRWYTHRAALVVEEQNKKRDTSQMVLEERQKIAAEFLKPIEKVVDTRLKKSTVYSPPPHKPSNSHSKFEHYVDLVTSSSEDDLTRLSPAREKKKSSKDGRRKADTLLTEVSPNTTLAKSEDARINVQSKTSKNHKQPLRASTTDRAPAVEAKLPSAQPFKRKKSRLVEDSEFSEPEVESVSRDGGVSPPNCTDAADDFRPPEKKRELSSKTPIVSQSSSTVSVKSGGRKSRTRSGGASGSDGEDGSDDSEVELAVNEATNGLKKDLCGRNTKAATSMAESQGTLGGARDFSHKSKISAQSGPSKAKRDTVNKENRVVRTQVEIDEQPRRLAPPGSTKKADHEPPPSCSGATAPPTMVPQVRRGSDAIASLSSD
ncbi:hypothetical protein HDU93_008298 [Gonapodya sp. JEL0774]|nr:hypothetical protein HDU93_008298 [Gonapodya sp. JEL0774]